MRSERAVLVAALLATALSSVAAEPIERILAVVDGRAVMLSEVRLVQRLRGVSAEAALEQAIDERLMFDQAVRLPQTTATREEEEAAYRSLREQLRQDEELDDALLREMARRQVTILKYVEFRFRPLIRAVDPAPGSEGDAGENGGDGLDQRVEAWVAELREAAAIRYNPSLPSEGTS